MSDYLNINTSGDIREAVITLRPDLREKARVGNCWSAVRDLDIPYAGIDLENLLRIIRYIENIYSMSLFKDNREFILHLLREFPELGGKLCDQNIQDLIDTGVLPKLEDIIPLNIDLCNLEVLRYVIRKGEGLGLLKMADVLHQVRICRSEHERHLITQEKLEKAFAAMGARIESLAVDDCYELGRMCKLHTTWESFRWNS